MPTKLQLAELTQLPLLVRQREEEILKEQQELEEERKEEADLGPFPSIASQSSAKTAGVSEQKSVESKAVPSSQPKGKKPTEPITLPPIGPQKSVEALEAMRGARAKYPISKGATPFQLMRLRQKSYKEYVQLHRKEKEEAKEIEAAQAAELEAKEGPKLEVKPGKK